MKKILFYIFYLSLIFIWLTFISSDIILNQDTNESQDSQNNCEAVINLGLDTPISVRFETTPRNIGNGIASFGISSITGSVLYWSIRTYGMAHTYIPNTPMAQIGLLGTCVVSGGLIGLGTYAIARAQGPRGPIVNIKTEIGISRESNSENLRIENNVISSSNDNDFPTSSPFESFHLLDPIAENPIIALLSVSILLLLVCFQCYNFIIIRSLILRYELKIQSFFKENSKIKVWIQKMFVFLNKTYQFYFLGFFILGYINLIAAIIFLFYLFTIFENSSN